MSRKEVVIVDLFAGGGGASNGAKEAIALLKLVIKIFVAVNHWLDAIETHKANHPEAKHYHCAVEEVDPRKAITGNYVDLLIAGPSCTFHSVAQGGRPLDEQSRSSPWSILNWLKDLYVKAVIIENVPEFAKWGPLNSKGRPIKKLRGTTFNAWLKAIESLGYNVEWKILNAADYGDATSRRRLFVLARRKGTGPIQWPEPTHVPPTPKNQPSLFYTNKPTWRTARDIIDWSIPMGPETSIFNREAYGKQPLVPNTMRRIFVGLFKFGLSEFVIGQQSGATPRGIDWPVPTIAAAGKISLIKPYIVKMYNESNAGGIDEPLPTVVGGQGHLYLAQPTEPYLVEFHGGESSDRRSRSLDDPLPTQDTSNRFGLVQPKPYIVQFDHTGAGDGASRSVDQPLATIVTKQNMGLVRPYLISSDHGSPDFRGQALDVPLPTIAGHNGFGIAQPYIVKFNGTGLADSIDAPLPTVTSKARFALCIPLVQGYLIVDIRFRMLHWRELAAAMSWPSTYIWLNAEKKKPSNEVITKMIGNGWPKEMGAALCFVQLK